MSGLDIFLLVSTLVLIFLFVVICYLNKLNRKESKKEEYERSIDDEFIDPGDW